MQPTLVVTHPINAPFLSRLSYLHSSTILTDPKEKIKKLPYKAGIVDAL